MEVTAELRFHLSTCKVFTDLLVEFGKIYRSFSINSKNENMTKRTNKGTSRGVTKEL